MFTIILIMLTGMLAGCTLHRWPMKGLGRIIDVLIWLLLFLLGIEVGSNATLMRSLPTLGMEACILALGTTLGSIVAAWLLWRALSEKGNGHPTSTTDGNVLHALRGSGVIVGFFIAGVCMGLSGRVPQVLLTSEVSFYALCALMGCVGLSIGHSPETLRSFRRLNPRLALLPVCTIIGTWAGSAFISLLLGHRSLTDCLAIGSDFYYGI